ncbi:hypothetical protein D7V80_28210 [Corallococcus sp. CA054B]|uniref:hypothetical protein n=1 Tax=Corallococcus sp. CA054B TaxID=2316734 RepID=UPI000EA17792|nr:hypothetical protein [Corallococcus sp. CA054B]RKG64074.1 hypothetical protein D7V80_28210 [Corallococcus sp. CA054B]
MTSSDRAVPGRRRHIVVASLTGLAMLEVPDLFLLQRWAKFRMLHGLRTGHPVEAAHQVRTRGVTVEDPASGMSSLASSVAWIPWAPGRQARSHLARGVLASALGDLPLLHGNRTKHPAPLPVQAGLPTP